MALNFMCDNYEVEKQKDGNQSILVLKTGVERIFYIVVKKEKKRFDVAWEPSTIFDLIS